MTFKKGHTINLGRKFPNKKPPSEETKKKISLSLKGRIPKNINEIAGANKGKKWTKEQREKCSGKNASNWKGGRTKLEKLLKGSVLYKEWRTAVYERDKFSCKKCGASGGSLNADHFPVPYCMILDMENITSLKDAIENPESILWKIENGRTLCEGCHRVTKTWGMGKSIKEKTFVTLGLEQGVLQKQGNTIYYGEDKLGGSMQKSITFLTENEDTKRKIEEDIRNSLFKEKAAEEHKDRADKV